MLDQSQALNQIQQLSRNKRSVGNREEQRLDKRYQPLKGTNLRAHPVLNFSI
jgi:hypothetical protein